MVVCVATILLLTAPTAETRPQWYEGDGYDWWNDCSDVPDPLEYLPIYLGSESPGFVDVGRSILRGGVRWRVLQYTRDKDLGPTRISAGRWYGGMGADEWAPGGDDDARRHLEAFRVVSWEIDGNRHAVDPSCTVVLNTDEHAIGFYNAWVRFNEPGLHTLKVTGRQTNEFYFVVPLDRSGLGDPFGLEGRRVFLRGESVGDTFDEELTHTYELHVGREDR